MEEHMVVPAGFAALIPVVIILVSIVAQLVKAGKRTSAGERPPRPGTPSESPGGELQDFLRSLSGQQTPPEPATLRVPPPPPPPAPAPQKVRAVHSPAPKKRVVQKPPPPPGQTQPVSAKVQQPASLTPTPVAAPAREPAPRLLGRNVALLFRDRTSLREAIVLREVLGPPLGARTQPHAGA